MLVYWKPLHKQSEEEILLFLNAKDRKSNKKAERKII